jgi:hypothetical protein
MGDDNVHTPTCPNLADAFHDGLLAIGDTPILNVPSANVPFDLAALDDDLQRPIWSGQSLLLDHRPLQHAILAHDVELRKDKLVGKSWVQSIAKAGPAE